MRIFLTIALLVTVACGGHAPQKAERSDTLKVKAKEPENNELSLNDAITEFKDSAQRETTLDSTKVESGDTLRLVIRMIKGSPFTLPKEYRDLAGLDTIWNMRSSVHFSINNQVMMEGTVEKTDFDIDNSLKKYGILILPEVTSLSKSGFS